MRILIVADKEIRNAGFSVRYIDHNVDHAYYVDEAKAYLYMFKYDLVCLDHELDDKNETGMDVARYISAMHKDDLPDKILVHSPNPVHVDRMFKQLIGLGIFVSRRPF